ncbi:MAG: hypothetical protein WC404_05505 [Candidatus Omnitrophota bacterium]|jgi:hypothetical protein
MNKMIVFLALCCFLLNAGVLDGQEAKPPKEEVLKELVAELDTDTDVIANIPGLKIQKDSEGKEYYSYTVDNKEMRLEDLDADTLEDLLTKTYNEEQNIRQREIIQQTEILRETRNAMQESTNIRNIQNRTRNIPTSAPKK